MKICLNWLYVKFGKKERVWVKFCDESVKVDMRGTWISGHIRYGEYNLCAKGSLRVQLLLAVGLECIDICCQLQKKLCHSWRLSGENILEICKVSMFNSKMNQMILFDVIWKWHWTHQRLRLPQCSIQVAEELWAKTSSVVTWFEHYINLWIGLTVVKNLIPKASILYHTSVAAVSAGVYLYIRQ